MKVINTEEQLQPVLPPSHSYSNHPNMINGNLNGINGKILESPILYKRL